MVIVPICNIVTQFRVSSGHDRYHYVFIKTVVVISKCKVVVLWAYAKINHLNYDTSSQYNLLCDSRIVIFSRASVNRYM